MRVFAQIGAAIVLAWTAAPATAQTGDPNADACANKTGDEKIAGCTAAITSGKWSNENLATVFYDRGNGYAQQNDPYRAIADYSEAIRLNPQYAKAYFNRGTAWNLVGRTSKGEADIARARVLNPNIGK